MPAWNVVSVDKHGGRAYRLQGMTEPKARAEFERKNPTGDGKTKQILLTHKGLVVDYKPKEKAV